MKKNTLLFFFFLVLGVISSIPADQNEINEEKIAFQKFVKKYGKKYDSKEEFEKRFEIFRENGIKAEKYQRKLDEEKRGGRVNGRGKFADLSEEEFRSKILMRKPDGISSSFGDYPCDLSHPFDWSVIEEDVKDLPESFDWRTKGLVTRVKDQGSAGTCWAFSTAGNIEGQWAKAGNTLVSLSEEQLNDCDPNDCNVFGGWPCRAYQYVIKAGGIMAEKNYPYCAGTGACYPCPPNGYNATFCGPPAPNCNISQSCRAFGNFKTAAKIKGFNWFENINEDQLKALLYKVGPLSIAINAGGGLPPLQLHEWGVWSPYECVGNSVNDLDHAVLLVGYGVEKSELFGDTPYWIVKNSWSADWGDKGYFKMLRGSNICGITLQVTSSIV